MCAVALLINNTIQLNICITIQYNTIRVQCDITRFHSRGPCSGSRSVHRAGSQSGPAQGLPVAACGLDHKLV
jgi:hypothetical protein